MAVKTRLVERSLANSAPPARRPAQPQWGWSGVVRRPPFDMPAADIMEVILLLPKRRSSEEHIVFEFKDLAARFLSDLVQDEYGPTRAESAAALSDLIGAVEQVAEAIDALSVVARKSLSATLASLPIRIPKPPLDSFAAFESEEQALETLSLAAGDLRQPSPARADLTDFEAIERMRSLSERTMALLHNLDTTSDSNLQFGPAPKVAEADGPDDELAQIGNAIGQLVVRLRTELDRLSRHKGPDGRISLLILVARLCDLWERETGQAVSVNPYQKTRYDGAPQSEAGVFVAGAVAALAPTSSSLGALMKESGRDSPPGLKSQLQVKTFGWFPARSINIPCSQK